jgi:hypothetical protein
VQRYETLARSVGMGDEAWHRQVPMLYSVSRPYTPSIIQWMYRCVVLLLACVCAQLHLDSALQHVSVSMKAFRDASTWLDRFVNQSERYTMTAVKS